jgi:hypothetical protein
MNDNLQQASGFDINLNRNLYGENEVYDSVSMDALIQTGSIKSRQIYNLDFLKVNNVVITNSEIEDVGADKITDGTLDAVIPIGATNIKIDGDNNRITINDGSNDRVLLGYLAGKF